MSAGVTITCDHRGNLGRVAVWQDRALRDLYLGQLDQPDLTGAIVGGKVARTIPAQQAAFVDCGAVGMIYVNSRDKIMSGQYLTLQVKTTGRYGKAHIGAIHDPADNPAGPGIIGIITPPPALWERALLDLKQIPVTAISFQDRHHHGTAKAWLAQQRADLSPVLQPLGKAAVHPELDEIIDNMLEPKIALPQGGSIVIEQTEALVAIDVNSGENNNALAVNLLAARMAAQQVRLRNLSGTILMDYLKMPQRTDNAKLLHTLGGVTADDPAGVKVFGLTKLGLVEMTRTRRGPSLYELRELIEE